MISTTASLCPGRLSLQAEGLQQTYETLQGQEPDAHAASSTPLTHPPHNPKTPGSWDSHGQPAEYAGMPSRHEGHNYCSARR